MRKIGIYILFVFGAVCFASGCAAGKRPRGILIEVDLPALVLKPDSAGNAVLDVSLRISGECFSRRNRLFLFPELMSGNETVRNYPPLVLDGPVYARKAERLRVLEGYDVPYAGIARKVHPGRGYVVPYRTQLL